MHHNKPKRRYTTSNRISRRRIETRDKSGTSVCDDDLYRVVSLNYPHERILHDYPYFGVTLMEHLAWDMFAIEDHAHLMHKIFDNATNGCIISRLLFNFELCGKSMLFKNTDIPILFFRTNPFHLLSLYMQYTTAPPIGYEYLFTPVDKKCFVPVTARDKDEWNSLKSRIEQPVHQEG